MRPLTRRQREILDYLNEFIEHHGYSPSLEGDRPAFRSVVTGHGAQASDQSAGEGFIKRAWNRSRSVELVPTGAGGRMREIPLQGHVAAGDPIEAVVSPETVAVPDTLTGARATYALRVSGQSMIDEQIRDGDIVIVEDRKVAENGEMVIALLDGSEVTLKTFHREGGRIRLQPANPTMQPIVADAGRVQVQGVVIGLMRKY